MADLFNDLLGMQDYPEPKPAGQGVDLFQALQVEPDPHLSHPIAGQMFEAGYSPDEVMDVEIDAPRDQSFYQQELVAAPSALRRDMLQNLQAQKQTTEQAFDAFSDARAMEQRLQQGNYGDQMYDERLPFDVRYGAGVGHELGSERYWYNRVPVLGELVRGTQQAAFSTASLLARAQGKEQEAQGLGALSGGIYTEDQGALSRGFQGAVRNLEEMMLARVGGTAGVIASAATRAANEAINEGRLAGLEGSELGRYALVQGAIEGTVTSAFQLAGLGGLESQVANPLKLMAKQGAKRAVADVIKRYVISTGQELPEELTVELAQILSSRIAGVDQRELSDPSYWDQFADVALQTILTIGLAEGGRAAGEAAMRSRLPGEPAPPPAEPQQSIQEAIAQREAQQQQEAMAQLPEVQGEAAGGADVSAKPQWAVLEAAANLAQTQERVDPVTISQQLNVPAEQAVNAWQDLVRMNVLDAQGRATGQAFQQPASMPEVQVMLADPEATIDRAVRAQLPPPGIEQARVEVERALNEGADPRRSPALRDLAFELARRTQQVRQSAQPQLALSGTTTPTAAPSPAAAPQMGTGQLGAAMAEAGVTTEGLPPGPAEVAPEPVQPQPAQPPLAPQEATPEPAIQAEQPATAEPAARRRESYDPVDMPKTLSAAEVAQYASDLDPTEVTQGFQGPEGIQADLEAQLKNPGGRFVKVELPLAMFSTDATVDPARAKQYAEEAGRIPSVVAGMPRGVKSAIKLVVPDGNHRIAAAKARGQTKAWAYVPEADIDQIAKVMKRLGLTRPTEPEAEPKAEPADADDRMVPAGRVRKAIEDARRQGEKIGRSVDAMTGIFNRVGFKDASVRLEAKADKENQPIAYVFMDLANLKQFNDNLSAQAGDAIIMEAVNALTANIRTEARGKGGVGKPRTADVPGVVARRGGDELVAALYGVDQATANKVMERVAQDYDRRLNERGLNQQLQEATGIPNMQGFLAYGLEIREPNSEADTSALMDDAEQGMYKHKKAKKKELGLPLSREEAEAAVQKPPPKPKPLAKKKRAKRPSGFAKLVIEKRLAKFGHTLPSVKDEVQVELSQIDEYLANQNPFLFEGEVPPGLKERFEKQTDILTKFRSRHGGGRGEDIMSAIGLDRYEQYIRSWLGEADPTVARRTAEMLTKEPGIEPSLAFDAWLYNEVILEERDSELIGRIQLQPGATFEINGSPFEVGFMEGDPTEYLIGPVTIPLDALPEQIPIDTGTFSTEGEAVAPFDIMDGSTYPSARATKKRSDVDNPPPDRDLFIQFRSPEGVQPIRFKSEDVNARSVHAPELIQLAEDLLGRRPQVRRMKDSVRGSFQYEGDYGQVLINRTTAANPQQLLKTLAHEIGHANDWMPDKTMARGNLIGRLVGSARKFLKNEFGDLNDAEFRAELIAMSKDWRGDFDENGTSHFDQYRRSSSELYADFVSLFLNDPVKAKRDAPKFFEAFVSRLEKKPDFAAFYVQLMKIMDGDSAELIRARANRATASYEDGRAKINAAIQERRTMSRTGIGRFFDSLTTLLLNRYDPIEKVQRQLEKEGVILPDSANARYILNDLTHAENEQHRYIQDLERIMVEAREAGLDLDGDLGFFLENNRIASEGRTKTVVGEDGSEIIIEIANPRGTQIQDAEVNLRSLMGRLGSDKAKALQKWAKKFYDLNWSIVERLHRSGAISDGMLASLSENRYSYATFAVTKYLSDTLSPSIIRQVGTFSDIANPVESTMMKSLSMIRFATLNEAKRDIAEKFLRSFVPKIHRRIQLPPGEWQPRMKAGLGLDWLTYKNKGLWFALEVDAEIAKTFRSKNIGEMGRVLGFLRTPTYRIFHPLYVSWSTAFFTRNLFFRDRRRLVKNIGAKTGMSAFELNKQWLKSIPNAWRRARGIPDRVIDEMLDAKALATPFVKSTAMIDDIDFQSRKAVEAGLRRMKPEKSLSILRPLKLLADMVETLNVFGETVAKVGGWKALGKAGIEGRERAYLVDRYVGTPPWTRKGDATFLTNSIFFYSNVRWQGLSADLDLAKNPKTAAGYWWRTVLHNLLPKALMLAAAEGMFGDELEELMSAVPDWAKENYDVIPLGFAGEGDATKPIFVAMPPDDTGRFMGAMFWKLLNAHKHTPEKSAQGIMRELYGQTGLGSLNPVLGLMSNWTQYLIGRNPYDAFRERPIMPRDVFNAQGWYATKHMIHHSLEQTGILRAFISPIIGDEADISPMSSLERAISFPAGATGLVRISGEQGDHWNAVALEDQERDRFKLSLPDVARRLTKQRYRLQRFSGVGKITPSQAEELKRLQRWYSKIYLPYTQRIKIASERGDKKSESYWRNQLEVVSGRFSKKGDD